MIRLAGAAAATAAGAYLARWAASAFGDGPVFRRLARALLAIALERHASGSA